MLHKFTRSVFLPALGRTMDKPDTYWTRVYTRAAKLLRERPELSGDAAYSAARHQVEVEVTAQPVRLEP